jgi:N-acetylglutamate synthase-like GNAT family acetyltransferase
MQEPEPLGHRFLDEKIGACSVATRPGKTGDQTKLDRVLADALLRSVVVHPTRRRAGFGSAIVEWVMKFASGSGISRLFALTTTSQVFFNKCGFQTIDRASVPQSICGLTEFSEPCCSSAFVMKRDLTRTV